MTEAFPYLGGGRDSPRAGCWAHARRKFVEAEPTAPEVARAILRPLKSLFDVEARAKDMTPDQRLCLRQEESRPMVEALHLLPLDRKYQLLPKHPPAQAIGYALNQWKELTLFLSDGAVSIHNNLAEQQMKRIALPRKYALSGPLSQMLFLVTDNGSSFIVRRFGAYVKNLYRHVRIQYRTPTQLGLLERFHQSFKDEEVYWRQYDDPRHARRCFTEFKVRYNGRRPY